MDRAKPASILIAVLLIATALMIGRSFLEPNSKSEIGSAWIDAAPNIEEIFASKRSAAQGSGNATRHSPASSHRASDQAERELVRAVSALDQAHARLAAALIAVSQAEATSEFLERRIADLEALGEGSAAQSEVGEEPFALATKSRQRAKNLREESRRKRAAEQVNVRSAEERVEAAELQLESLRSRD